MRNSLICKLIKVHARIKEQREKKMEKEHELSTEITAPPSDTAALDRRSVFAKVSSQGSGT